MVSVTFHPLPSSPESLPEALAHLPSSSLDGTRQAPLIPQTRVDVDAAVGLCGIQASESKALAWASVKMDPSSKLLGVSAAQASLARRSPWCLSRSSWTDLECMQRTHRALGTTGSSSLTSSRPRRGFLCRILANTHEKPSCCMPDGHTRLPPA